MSETSAMSPRRPSTNLKDFVFKGPFRDQGMPDFTGKLTEADVVKIQAFIQGTADAIRPKPAIHGTGQAIADSVTLQTKRAARDDRAALCRQAPEALPQNIRPSFTSTQRPFLICCTWVMVVARWLVFEKMVGGELKISRNLSPDSSASSIFWPVRSLPALLA